MEEFKIRASAAGQLMTEPRAKTAVLSKTAETYLQNWYKGYLYGIRKDFSSRQTEKGVLLEDLAIDKAIEWLDLSFVLKNEEFFEDDFFTGIPDLITEDEVLDIKCSWDCFTFPLFEKAIPTSDYEYQLQVYMHLTKKKKARLVYVLLDTPGELDWRNLSYEGLPQELRIKTFEIAYDSEVLAKLQDRVEASRKYLETIKLF